MNEITVTVTGNVASDPTLRWVGDGVAVANLRLATTPRRLHRETGEWRDGETLFFSVTCWRQLAQNVAGSLRKGDRVVVSGRLGERSYETRDGEQRHTMEIEAVAIGPDLSWTTALPARVRRPAPAGATESTAESPGGEGGGDADVPGEKATAPAA